MEKEPPLNKRSSSNLLRIALLIGVSCILIAIGYCGFQVHSLSNRQEKIKKDYMVINSVSFGLLSVDEWRDNIIAAVDSQIQQFKFTPQQSQDLKKEIEQILHGLGETDSLTETTHGIYETHFLRGKPGVTYTLSVLSQNINYSAVSTMPPSVHFDSLTLEGTSGFGQERINAIVNFQDPAGEKNFYQFTETINNKPFPGNNFVFSDRLSDGKYISTTLRTDSSYIVSKDTVTVNMYSIDENIYNYFLELRQSSGRGAFNTTASPANPATNISGGALGYFSAHTIQTRAIIVN